MEEELVFESLDCIEVPVTVGNQKYILREANGDVAVKFQNARLAKHEYNEDGRLVRLKDTADLEPFLVSMCLFKKVENEETPVSETTIRGWPSHIQSKLFDTAKKISHIDETEDLESLEKQLIQLQKRIEQLRKKETPLKNLSAG